MKVGPSWDPLVVFSSLIMKGTLFVSPYFISCFTLMNMITADAIVKRQLIQRRQTYATFIAQSLYLRGGRKKKSVYCFCIATGAPVMNAEWVATTTVLMIAAARNPAVRTIAKVIRV